MNWSRYRKSATTITGRWVDAITSSFRMGWKSRMMEGVRDGLLNPVTAHDLEVRAEGARGFWAALILLTATILVAIGTLTAPIRVASASHPIVASPTPDSEVQELRARTKRQDQTIAELLALFEQSAPTTTAPAYPGQTYTAEEPTDHHDHVTVIRETRTEQAPRPRASETKKPAPAPKKDAVNDTVDKVKDTVDKVRNSTKGLAKAKGHDK